MKNNWKIGDVLHIDDKDTPIVQIVGKIIETKEIISDWTSEDVKISTRVLYCIIPNPLPVDKSIYTSIWYESDVLERKLKDGQSE